MALRAWRLTLVLVPAALALGCFDLEMPERAEAECVDPEADVCWQKSSSAEQMDWSQAMSYCDGMGLGGYAWHLPSIDELRSFVEECDWTEPGGGCGVEEGCLQSSCCDSDACTPIECEAWGGPAYPAGCYWQDGALGQCGCYWSSSEWTDYSGNAWVLNYSNASISGLDKYSMCYVRCLADYGGGE